MAFLCASCECLFATPIELNAHTCGGLSLYYLNRNRTRRIYNDRSVSPWLYCPACARPFGLRTGIGGQNSTPAHNIISRYALRANMSMERANKATLIGDSITNIEGLSTYANILLAYFFLHFDFAISQQKIPQYRIELTKRGKPISLWKFVQKFMSDNKGYLFAESPNHPFASGDGDRYDAEFSHRGLLDRLFGASPQTIARKKPAKEKDWNPEDSPKNKLTAIIAAINGIAPNDSYTKFYCQKGTGAQCAICEKRQGEADLLCRYYAAKAAVGTRIGLVQLAAGSMSLLSFIGLQFCCNKDGVAVTSLDDVSEEYLMKVTCWQIYQHLKSLFKTLKNDLRRRKNVMLEVFYANWIAFSRFYSLCSIRLAAGGYTRRNRYQRGLVSDGIFAKIRQLDDVANTDTCQLNTLCRRFSLTEGDLRGGKACLLKPCK